MASLNHTSLLPGGEADCGPVDRRASRITVALNPSCHDERARRVAASAGRTRSLTAESLSSCQVRSMDLPRLTLLLRMATCRPCRNATLADLRPTPPRDLRGLASPLGDHTPRGQPRRDDRRCGHPVYTRVRRDRRRARRRQSSRAPRPARIPAPPGRACAALPQRPAMRAPFPAWGGRRTAAPWSARRCAPGSRRPGPWAAARTCTPTGWSTRRTRPFARRRAPRHRAPPRGGCQTVGRRTGPHRSCETGARSCGRRYRDGVQPVRWAWHRAALRQTRHREPERPTSCSRRSFGCTPP